MHGLMVYLKKRERLPVPFECRNFTEFKGVKYDYYQYEIKASKPSAGVSHIDEIEVGYEYINDSDIIGFDIKNNSDDLIEVKLPILFYKDNEIITTRREFVPYIKPGETEHSSISCRGITFDKFEVFVESAHTDLIQMLKERE